MSWKQFQCPHRNKEVIEWKNGREQVTLYPLAPTREDDDEDVTTIRFPKPFRYTARNFQLDSTSLDIEINLHDVPTLEKCQWIYNLTIGMQIAEIRDMNRRQRSVLGNNSAVLSSYEQIKEYYDKALTAIIAQNGIAIMRYQKAVQGKALDSHVLTIDEKNNLSKKLQTLFSDMPESTVPFAPKPMYQFSAHRLGADDYPVHPSVDIQHGTASMYNIDYTKKIIRQSFVSALQLHAQQKG